MLLILEIGWAFLSVVLVVVGSIIGLLIGLFVLFLLIGGLNAVLTDFIWGIPIESNWKSLLAHGFVLFIVLLIASIPQLVISLVIPNIITTIVLFMIYCFIDGFIAKNIAGYWEEEYE